MSSDFDGVNERRSPESWNENHTTWFVRPLESDEPTQPSQGESPCQRASSDSTIDFIVLYRQQSYNLQILHVLT